MSILLSQRTSVSFKYKTNVSSKYHNWSTTPIMVNISYATGFKRTDTVVGDYRDVKIENISPASGAEVQYQSIYFFSRPIEGQVFNPSTDFVYFKDIQVERKPYATPFVNGTRIDRVVDKTPYSNNGTNYGAMPTTDRHGKTGGAMSFNNSFIDLGNSNKLGITKNMSGFAWIKSSNTSAWNGIFGNHTGGGFVHFQVYGSGLNVYLYGPNAAYSNAEAALSNDVWYHVGFTYDGNTLKVYKNGVKLPTEAIAPSPASNITDITTVGIGRVYSTDRYFKGDIDDVRIYNRALSAEEVSLLYGSYEPKTQISSINSGLIGHWTLSEEDYNTSGSRVIDKTPYSNHGTNYGATFTTDRHGKSGGAMSFDGVNSYINLGTGTTFFPLSKFTVCNWIKSSGLASGMSINGIFSLTYGLTMYLGSTGHFSARLDDGAGIPTRTVAQNLYDNNFHHLCFLHDGVNQKMYIDGVLKDSVATSWTGTTRWPTNSVSIGHENNNPPIAKFKGQIDDLRIYNRALSANEISLLHSSYNPQTGGDSLQKGLILDMPLSSEYTKTETAGSQIMTDKTPYGNDGQNYGATISSDGASFDGVNDYIQTPITGTFPQASFCFWGFFDDPALNTKLRNESAFGDWISSRIHFGTRWSVGMHWNVNNSWTEIPATNLIYGWNHYCLVWNHSTSQKLVYINNVLSSTNATNGSITIGNLKIGNATNLNYYYRGNIKGFRIYDRAISADEIKSLYTQGAASLGGIPIYMKSCKEILDANPSNPSGVYQIQPILAEAPFSVYCDMTNDGGGWTLVNANLVDSTFIQHANVSTTYDANGGVISTSVATATGCGNPEVAGSTIKINNKILWTRVRYVNEFYSTSACWSINGAESYGGQVGHGNLEVYNSSLDTMKNCYLTCEQPQFTNFTNRCDNDAGNFFRFNGDSWKRFEVILRRKNPNLISGVAVGVSCNSLSASWRISNIYIK